MITRVDIEERVREWGLREDVVDKDYVIGWLLWGIGRDPVLGEKWIFKGGTCLKKCFLETYRFSEDLDFTVLPGGPVSADAVRPLLSAVLERVAEESGLDFSRRAPALKANPSGTYTDGRVYYIGPRRTPTVASVKLDLSASEVLVLVLPAAPASAGNVEDRTWTASPTVRAWGFGVPLETIRFAALNHLCVELGYGGSLRTIEPYSLRRTRGGNLLLHALRVDTRENRSYSVDRIQSVRVTTQTFTPVYQIEFSSSGIS